MLVLTNGKLHGWKIAEKGDRTNESEDGGDSDISLAYSYERKLSRDLDQLLEPAGLAFMKHVFFWYLCLEQWKTRPSLAWPIFVLYAGFPLDHLDPNWETI